ncbi:MAG: M90 family metallopeptidase [Planctomycetota bacterium]
MIFSWLRRRRRAKLLAEPMADGWPAWLERYSFYVNLDDDERAKLHDTLRVIVAEKNWEGCDGLELTEEMKVVIAAQAALLLLGIEHEYYRRVRTILVYPRTFGAGSPQRQSGGIVGGGGGHLGEAWYRGPVILSWDAAEHGAVDPKDGRNVVYHEFAHKLDMLDGSIDGTPPLAKRSDYREWARVMQEEYEILRGGAKKGRKTVLDRYGATNEAEFFAVAVEAFFEKPLKMERVQPELYALFVKHFRQDPAERLRRAARREKE